MLRYCIEPLHGGLWTLGTVVTHGLRGPSFPFFDAGLMITSLVSILEVFSLPLPTMLRNASLSVGVLSAP